MKKPLEFAVYGKKASGKTSILAALNLPRTKNPKGFTGRVVFPENYTTTVHEVEDIWNAKGKESQLQRGCEAVEAASECYKRGEMLNATAIADGFLRVQCEFTSREGGPYQIEMIDFAGELLESKSLGSGDSLIHVLHKELTKRDAFFVVIETPSDIDSADRLASGHNDLLKAFQSLRKNVSTGRFSIPIVMLISKWDRFEESAISNEKEMSESLERFFETYPSFQTIRDELRNTTKEDLFCVAPISALGVADTTESQFHKCQWNEGVLDSRFLEDPFVWAAEKVGRKRKLISRNRLRIALGSLVLLVLGATCVEYLIDKNKYDKVSSRFSDATGSTADYEIWLSDYAASPIYQHFWMKLGFSKRAAVEERDRVQAEVVDRDWQEVEDIDSRSAKYELVMTFLEKHPNSSQAARANSFVGEYEAEIQNKKEREKEAQEIARGEEKVQDSINNDFLLEAAEEITLIEDKNRIIKMCEMFKKTFPLRFKSKIDNFILKEQWEDAEQGLNEFDQKYFSWCEEIQSPEIESVVDNLKAEFERDYDKYLYRFVFKESGCSIEDTLRHCNRYLKKSPRSVMGKEVSALLSWCERHQKQDREYKFILSLEKITWDKNAQKSKDNFVRVWVDGDLKIDWTGVPSEPGSQGAMRQNSTVDQSFLALLSDKVELEIEIVEDDAFLYGGGDDDHGKATKTIDLSKQRGLPFSVKLPGADGDGGACEQTAHLKIMLLDSEPGLPQWSNVGK